MPRLHAKDDPGTVHPSNLSLWIIGHMRKAMSVHHHGCSCLSSHLTRFSSSSNMGHCRYRITDSCVETSKAVKGGGLLNEAVGDRRHGMPAERS